MLIWSASYVEGAKVGWAAAEGLLRRFLPRLHGEGGWLDAAMVSAAIGMTACTVYLCAADDSAAAASPTSVTSPLDLDQPCIILHDGDRRFPCRFAVEAEKEPRRRSDVHVSLDRPDSGRLAAFL